MSVLASVSAAFWSSLSDPPDQEKLGAAWLTAWLRGADPVAAARFGHLAAAATIESEHTVRPDLAAAVRYDPRGDLPC